MSFNPTHFTALPFCGPHTKLHGVKGLSKHYNLRFEPKLGQVIYEIWRIPYSCVSCTYSLDKPWYPRV